VAIACDIGTLDDCAERQSPRSSVIIESSVIRVIARKPSTDA